MIGRAPVPVLAVTALAWLGWLSTGLAAQGRDTGVTPPMVELGGGIGWVGQADAGTRDATMTANAPGEPEPLPFFSASGKTRSGAVGIGTVGINFSRRFGVEAGFQYSRPSLSVRVDEDVEDTPSLTVEGPSFEQYLTEGSLIYHFNSARFDSRRTVPFVLAGAGVFRQKADDGLTETGALYQAGLGFKWLSGLSPTGRARGAGLRLDVRYVFRDGGFDFEDGLRAVPVVGASVVFRF